MPRIKTKSSFIPLLILLAAISLWAFDTYWQASTARPAARRSAPAENPPLPSKTGRYETYTGCTLEPDRGNDGDSFRVKLPDGRAEIIRLYFVDTPESAFRSYGGGRNNHERIGQQAGDLGGITPQQAVEIGKRAKALALSLLSAAPFTLHTEWDDPFGDRRYHSFVELTHKGKKRFLHELLVENGLARIHTKGAPLPDGTSKRKQETRLFDLQQAAKTKEAGAWGL